MKMTRSNDEATAMKENVRISLLEQSNLHIQQSLERMEKRFDKIDSKLEKMDCKIDANFAYLNDKIDSRFMWMLITYFGGFAGTFGALVFSHLQHWL